MKYLQIVLPIIMVLMLTACVERNPLTANKITYEEALELQSIEFTYEGETYETQEISTFLFDPFFCFDWPGVTECGLGNTVFYKSFGLSTELSTNRQIRLSLTPGIRVKEALVETPNFTYYDTRPAFKDKENLEEKFLKEGSWINNDRNVKVKLMIGNPDTEFYFNDLLQDTDHFEILEIKKIKDRDYSFLIIGAFNAIIPDGRTWLPANEQAEPQVLSDGSFRLIVEPLEEK